jgi:hypothetical protein
MDNVVVRDDNLDHNFGYCQCLWGDNDCPNKAAWILENISNNGYAVMCEVHYDGFREFYDVQDIMVHEYTIEYHQKLVDKLKEKGPYG